MRRKGARVATYRNVSGSGRIQFPKPSSFTLDRPCGGGPIHRSLHQWLANAVAVNEPVQQLLLQQSRVWFVQIGMFSLLGIGQAPISS